MKEDTTASAPAPQIIASSALKTNEQEVDSPEEAGWEMIPEEPNPKVTLIAPILGIDPLASTHRKNYQGEDVITGSLQMTRSIQYDDVEEEVVKEQTKAEETPVKQEPQPPVQFSKAEKRWRDRVSKGTPLSQSHSERSFIKGKSESEEEKGSSNESKSGSDSDEEVGNKWQEKREKERDSDKDDKGCVVC